MNVVQGLKAVASSPRLLILTWLLEPSKYFPAVPGIDFTRDGVPLKLLTRKLNMEQPSVTEHMKVLLDVGLVVATKRGRSMFYRRDDRRIAQLKEEMVAAF